MVMYDNGWFQTKQNQFKPRIKVNHKIFSDILSGTVLIFQGITLMIVGLVKNSINEIS